MLFSSFQKRSISDQNNCIDFNYTISLNNSTGNCSFGVSGANQNGPLINQFNLSNGKIYDNNNYFIGGYRPNEFVNISGQLGSGVQDYYINGELIALGLPAQTGIYSWLYVNPSGTIANFNGFIKGKIPNYSLPNSDKYQYQNYIISGKIINNNPGLNFRIFNAEILNPESAFTLNSFTTGNISNTGYLVVSSAELGLNDESIPISLDTNFGPVDFSWLISGDYGIIPDIYLNVSPNENFVVNSVSKNYTVQFSNVPSGGNLLYFLEYYSGITGNIYFLTGAIKPVSGVISGTITGYNQLNKNVSGIVSGIDPKTSINESGSGFGAIYSDYLFTTGDFSFPYNINVSGLGNGTFNIDYLAQNNVTGFYSGFVNITGSYLQSLAYNFTGTGNNPGVATGIVPIGTGVILVYPTGCLSINSGLLNNIDFYQANLSVPFAFSDIISYPYSVLGVGYATGGILKGTVKTNFARNFEPGLYIFNKYYSGAISGSLIDSGNFNPNLCYSDQLQISSGLITGYFGYSGLLNCKDGFSLPSINITGIPSLIYNSSGQLFQSNTVSVLTLTGQSYTETSENSLAGGFTRTKISRLGNTASGTGIFSNVIRDCNSNLNGLWKEKLSSNFIVSGISGYFDNPDNNLQQVASSFQLSGTGSFDETTDTFFLQDSGFIHFKIEGFGSKHVLFKGLNTDNEENRVLEFRLFKNGFDFAGPFYGINYDQLNHRDPLITDLNYYDSYFEITNLESGDYSLMVTSQQALKPVIDFSQASFSGCESGLSISIGVNLIQGEIRQPIWFETAYQDITARSGVNYQPINLRYRNSIIGEQSYSYTGGYLLPGQTSYNFQIPVYDNHTFGYDHDFNLTIFNPSGCDIATNGGTTKTVKVTILEDEFGIITGNPFNGQTGAFYHNYTCVSKPWVPPPDPPNCVFLPCGPDPRCDSCAPNPECNVPCCNCNNYGAVSGNCHGLPVTGNILTGICGILSANGNGNTAGFVYIGELCCRYGASYKDGFISNCCTYDVRGYDKCCIGSSGFTPGTTYSQPPVPDCGNIVMTGNSKHHKAGPSCSPLMIFLQVQCQSTFTCADSSWQWSGYCSRTPTKKPLCHPATV